MLEPATAGEILSERIVWSLLIVVVLLGAQRRLAVLSRGGLAQIGARGVGLLAVAAVFLAVNWGTYIYGVNTEQVIQTSLGYFINPLVTVLLGVIVLRERLRTTQWVALGIGAVAVVVLAVDYGQPPWIALTLASSFGVYGLLKKKAAVDAVDSLAVETAVLVVPALAFIGWLAADGSQTLTTEGAGHALLLASTGLVTAVPLLLFGGAVGRVPLSTIGMLQYLAPVLQFLIGVLVYDEDMPTSRWFGFGLVWTALLILSVDALRAARGRRLDRTAEEAAPV